VKMWQIEREKQMEIVAKKKIELARIKSQQEVFNEITRKKEVEAKAIAEIIEKQTAGNTDLL
jgi:hypothetical protein